ncbi:Hypothetical predicted protein [Olea europaea subsp. europaea]|uniref:RPA-interacting protein n=1 Tax=Olea europaea subsp. europaea TaxID=158383 RepID=A0A8S0Q0H0_OLEEU|nr:Hypothetical predicted protein [Olea europaea subsp. europaea]
MAEDEGNRPHNNRPSLKSHISFNNYPKWKDKLRENCYKRVREDRTRLLWKLRLPKPNELQLNHKDLIKSTFQDIVSVELRKIKDSSLSSDCGVPTFGTASDDMIWEYDGLHTDYQGSCEELLFEMQRIFYEDLRTEESLKEPENFIETWEDEEDEYLARAVYEHMKLNGEQVGKEVWCPVCKRGELQQNRCLIYCDQCGLKLNRSDEISLDLLRSRLAEAHAEHLDRGCRLKPEFCVETIFELTALYIKCQGCDTFEVVI